MAAEPLPRLEPEAMVDLAEDPMDPISEGQVPRFANTDEAPVLEVPHLQEAAPQLPQDVKGKMADDCRGGTSAGRGHRHACEG